jgi:hypothetical protein
MGSASDRAPTAEQLNDQDDSREHQQQVNGRAADAADQAQQPENEEYGENRPQHGLYRPFDSGDQRALPRPSRSSRVTVPDR